MQKKTKMFGDMLMGQWGAPMPRKGSPITPGQQAEQWLRNLDEDTKFYTEEEMHRAFAILRRGHEKVYMPMTPEIMKALKQARRDISVERPTLKVQNQTPAERDHKAREDIAIMLMRNSQMGAQSCKEGWCGELFAYCRDNGHMPRTSSEIQLLVDGAQGTVDRIEGLKTGRICAPPMLVEKLINLGHSMLARREAITEAVVHGKPYRWGA